MHDPLSALLKCQAASNFPLTSLSADPRTLDDLSQIDLLPFSGLQIRFAPLFQMSLLLQVRLKVQLKLDQALPYA